MVKDFKCKHSEMLFHDNYVRKFKAIERISRRKLLMLHRAKELNDLRVPPGNRLEVLGGDRVGQFSIRINKQWRICFVWENGDALRLSKYFGTTPDFWLGLQMEFDLRRAKRETWPQEQDKVRTIEAA